MREKNNDLEAYLNSLYPLESAAAHEAKKEALLLNKDGISISPYEAHLLQFFVRLFKCKHFVELGTLTGYSALALLEALPEDGHLWTIELDPDHARRAQRIFSMAGHEKRVTLLTGRAEDHLPQLLKEGPFDGVFMDANKAAYPFYLDWALSAIKKQGLIMADNTLLKGVVPFHPGTTEREVSPPSKITQQLRIFNQRLTDTSLFDSILIPTFEGLSIAIKK